jgi:GalNAc-alpha-(1->4)-GalNAc-alpha-(1->3)-diNAcBac-PP-undecaprenol alpha-1,4-N-acetyl-D-galactosaminyltransferase
MSKNICIVSPSLKMGGIERALSVLADYFVQQDYTVTFISAQGGEKFYPLDQRIQFFEPDFKRKSGILGKIAFFYSMLFFIRKTVKKQNPDVVLSFGDAFNPIVLFALSGTKYPIYISDRTSPDFPFNAFIRFGKKWFYPKSAGFIAQTKRAADYKRKHFGDQLNITIIPNALKKMVRQDVPESNQVLFAGRLSFEKGPDRLLKAFAKINTKEDWKLIFAGNGPMQNELERMVKELGLTAKVSFLGKVNNIDKILSESAIFVLPSRLEGFPNALCEAMAIGLPCICFDAIATEDLIEHQKNGFVVKENDIDALAETIEMLMNDPALRKEIGNNAKGIAQKLDAAVIGNKVVDFMYKQTN